MQIYLLLIAEIKMYFLGFYNIFAFQGYRKYCGLLSHRNVLWGISSLRLKVIACSLRFNFQVISSLWKSTGIILVHRVHCVISNEAFISTIMIKSS